MKKQIILWALAAVAFAACEKPVPYEPGAPMDLNGPNVYFSSKNDIDFVLPSDVNTFELAICREDATDALTVPLKFACGYEGAFEIPESVEFQAGEDTVYFSVTAGEKFEMFKQYSFALTIPEEYTHAYKPQDDTPNIMVSVLQEDYVPYAVGEYFSEFLDYVTGGNWPAWEQVLEYSAITDTYRLPDLWLPGTFMTFQWDRAEAVTAKGVFSMDLDAGYGNLYAHVDGGEYDSETKTFVFYADIVDSSSWGAIFGEYFTITEVLE